MATCLSKMSLLFVVLMGFLWPSHARKHTFHVGEKDGWTMKSSESYNQWAEKYQFLVNDELVFKYKKGHDSVLVVNEMDYYKCNKDNPIKTLKVKGDKSRIKLDRSGPFFFISGHDQNCEYGQKMIVVVLSDHHDPPSPSPSSPTTISVPPVKPPSQSSSPSPTASHAPPVEPPSHSPSPSPVPHSDHSPSPTPALVDSPSHSPAAQPPLLNIKPHSDRSPSPSPEAAKTPAHVPLVEPPSHSPADQTPVPDSDQSPSPSPVGTTTPTHAPPSQSPSPSSRKKAPVPSDHIALPPDASSSVFSPDHAPATAPSSASGYGGSFVVTVGLGLVATIISTGLV